MKPSLILGLILGFLGTWQFIFFYFQRKSKAKEMTVTKARCLLTSDETKHQALHRRQKHLEGVYNSYSSGLQLSTVMLVCSILSFLDFFIRG
jgi:hypothetical protein